MIKIIKRGFNMMKQMMYLLCNTSDTKDPSKDWRAVGLFSSRAKAEEALKFNNEFITPMVVDEVTETEVEFPVKILKPNAPAPKVKPHTAKVLKEAYLVPKDSVPVPNKLTPQARRDLILDFLKGKAFTPINIIGEKHPEMRDCLSHDCIYLHKTLNKLVKDESKKYPTYKLK